MPRWGLSQPDGELAKHQRKVAAALGVPAMGRQGRTPGECREQRARSTGAEHQQGPARPTSRAGARLRASGQREGRPACRGVRQRPPWRARRANSREGGQGRLHAMGESREKRAEGGASREGARAGREIQRQGRARNRDTASREGHRGHGDALRGRKAGARRSRGPRTSEGWR